jgi:hypothetical protein
MVGGGGLEPGTLVYPPTRSNAWSTWASWSTTSRPRRRFFVELGLKLQVEGPVEGRWVDGLGGPDFEIAVVGLQNI